ncbi:UDP-N-acetylmuramoyl-L-alanine--D-glutamate ligase [Sphingosinicella sp. YJ22]|uniref:UDP-N-acetylmuramoyl-L-alanine--D-glutamate ligase n=1 Tax=Sphingosinicella sp. YJ22 TaxID=1104780 RepID=UPI001FAFA8A5|nr:UDP-N-acetylmuramoyl-L-alanine--D-glutamate ligase [Sphingosinicella sp. YJ22]
MITARAFSGKKYAVLGLARSGRATVEALLASGAQVVAWDEREEARAALAPLPFRGEDGSRSEPGEGESGGTAPSPAAVGGTLSPEGERGLSFADPLTINLTGFAGVVVSPGVPLNRHPIAAHARAAGVPVIGDIELFAQARAELPPHKVVGITGTNGKSTTTALVHHILETAGVPTAMGGNIGLPILAQDPLPEGGVYVLELSSYQIDLTTSLDCDVAVLLNVTPDHLDRYEGFEAYVTSKRRLFEMQTPHHVAITTDSPASADTFNEFLRDRDIGTAWACTEFNDILAVAAVADGEAYHYGERFARQKDWPNLQGPHNAENAAAAAAAALELGIDLGQIEEGLRTYPGLPHRMQRVGEKDGVLFVNDSKATNPDSTAPALAAYPHIHWIVGGLAKTEDLGPCEQYLGHVRAAYTIGESGPMFARLLHGKVPVTESQVLEKAVTDAKLAARPGEVVLLSPACASFDQFKDYEARGEAFRAAVEKLA